MHVRHLSPTLLALTLGFAPLGLFAAAAAPSDAVRDEHARAVKAAIDINAKQVAVRQLDEWIKAGYADAATPSVKEALQIAFNRAFDPKFDDKSVPTANVSKIFAEIASVGGSPLDQILRQLNEARRVIDLEGPQPLVLPAEEKMAALQRTVVKMVATYEKEFAAALEQVKAAKKDEEELWNLDETRPAEKKRAEAIQRKAVELRLECMQIYYFAHMMLREVATRGADFGIDPKPVQASLAGWAKTNKEILDDWDFQWAEMHPQLQFYIAIAQCEGARQGVPKYAPADCESGLMKVIDMDLEQVPAGAREAVKTLQIKAWASLLRWELERGTPVAWDRGLALFLDFQSRIKDNRTMGLASPDTDRAIAAAQTYIVAGRINAAKGNMAVAQQLWAAVKSAKNPLSDVASKWIGRGTASGGDGKNSNPWAEEPVAAEPSSALSVGQAMLREAVTANPKQAREFAMSAAAGLRNGVLGLSTAAYADQFVENAAPVYRSYSNALAKLDMPYHAAAAAQEGLRQIRARISEKNNPWKDKKGAWTQAGQQVNTLINTAISAGSILNARTRTAAAKRLFDETIQLAQQLNPELVGKGLEWSLIVGKYNDGDFIVAIEDAKAYSKKYPEDFVKAASLILRARLGLLDKLDGPTATASDKAKLPEAQKELDDNVGKLEKFVDGEMAKTTDPVKLAPLVQLQIAVASAKIKSKIKQKKYDEVFANLGPEFWKKPPTDADLGIAMLKMLAQAVHESHMQLSGMAKLEDKPKPVEAAKLAAAWTTYAEAMRHFKKFAPRYTATDTTALRNSSIRLAQVAQYVSSQAEQNARAKAEGMAEISEEAKRFFADFIEGTLNERSRPGLVYMVAQTLWEIGDKPRSARLFEMYKVKLAEDPQILTYRADPKAALDPVAAVITTRTEFKKPWDEIVDLLSDPPGYLADLIRNGSAAMQGKGLKRDYGEALTKIEALKKLIADAGYLDADGKKKMQESLETLRALTLNLASTISIDSNLAQFYRESGKAEMAVKLYRSLYEEYDPTNAVYAAGYVEGVLEALKTNAAGVDKATVSGARDVAGQNLRFFSAGSQRDQYWISWLQVLELSKSMGAEDAKVVAKQLQFTMLNKSTPRDDLHLPVVAGDDPRVRRADNPGSVLIAQRYLELFDGTPELKRPFRVDQIEVQGKTHALFVAADAPAIVGQVETAADGEEIILFKAADAPVDAPAAAPVPAPADAPAAAPAQP